jgi:hypothetical protein
MLLRVLFCFSFILSALWLAVSATYVDNRIGWDNLMSMNPSDLAFFITAVCIPVVILWVIMGLFYYGGIIQKQGEFLEVMLYYMKDSADRNRIMSKSLLESREMLRSSENMRYIDTFVLELNNVITEIAIRFNILRRSSAETLWNKVHAGDRWAFCNVILDNARDIPDFDFALAKSAIKDKKLAESIKIFCQRVEHLFGILRQNESSAMFADIIESSSLGELYRRMSTVNEQQKNFDKSFKSSLKDDGQKNEDDTLFSIAEDKSSETYSDTELPNVNEDEPADIAQVHSYHNDKDDWEKKKKEIMSSYGKFEIRADDED